MKWPFSKTEKPDPLKAEEAKNDNLKKRLNDLREELLQNTVAHTVRAEDDR